MQAASLTTHRRTETSSHRRPTPARANPPPSRSARAPADPSADTVAAQPRSQRADLLAKMRLELISASKTCCRVDKIMRPWQNTEFSRVKCSNMNFLAWERPASAWRKSGAAGRCHRSSHEDRPAMGYDAKNGYLLAASHRIPRKNGNFERLKHRIPRKDAYV